MANDDRGWTAEDVPDQAGRTFLVTGANTGLGFEAAECSGRAAVRRPGGDRAGLEFRLIQRGPAVPRTVEGRDPKWPRRCLRLQPLEGRRMRADYASLMARYQAGDVQACEALHRHLALELPGIVRSFAPDVVTDGHLISDICRDVHLARRSYHPRRPFEPWVIAVARHAVSRRVSARRRLLGDIRARLFSRRPPPEARSAA